MNEYIIGLWIEFRGRVYCRSVRGTSDKIGRFSTNKSKDREKTYWKERRWVVVGTIFRRVLEQKKGNTSLNSYVLRAVQ